jgi:hypothetical protein
LARATFPASPVAEDIDHTWPVRWPDGSAAQPWKRVTRGGRCLSNLDLSNNGNIHSTSLSNLATRASVASPIEEDRKDNDAKADRFPRVLPRMFGGGSQFTCQQEQPKDVLLNAFSRCPLARPRALHNIGFLSCLTTPDRESRRTSATGCVLPGHMSPTGYFAPNRCCERGHSIWNDNTGLGGRVRRKLSFPAIARHYRGARASF